MIAGTSWGLLSKPVKASVVALIMSGCGAKPSISEGRSHMSSDAGSQNISGLNLKVIEGCKHQHNPNKLMGNNTDVLKWLLGLWSCGHQQKV